MRASCYTLAWTIATIACVTGVAQAGELTGKMTLFNHLAGRVLTCATSVPPMNGRMGHSDESTATFDIVAGNVIHTHIAGNDYAGDFYIGYDERRGKYWQTAADSLGMHGFLESPDAVTYTGTSSIGPNVMDDTITYGRTANDSTTAHEVLSGHGVQTAFDTVCRPA